MKNIIITLITAAILGLPASAAAADMHITKQSVRVTGADTDTALIVALYSGSELIGAHFYRGQTKADYAEDMKDIMPYTTKVKAFLWDTDTQTPSAAVAGGEISELPDAGETLYITVGDNLLSAELADNSSAAALASLLMDGDITINMSDYGNFEKVGDLGTELPRNDEQITTEPGDLILYQGRSFVIYYDTNSWNFTRLGKINDITQSKLKEILGSGDVQVTLSIG